MNWIEKTWKYLEGYFSDVDLWIGLGQGALKILAIIIIASIAVRFGKSVIRNVFKIRSKGPIRITERRQATLTKLLENVLSYAIYFIGLVMTLEAFGLDITAILAGAGVVGLAVGFGAQNLVRDVITGFFIIFEDQFSVGDYIRIGTSEGNVEEIGIRTTKIKSFTGEQHIIPNGNISEVTNYSIHNSIALVDISIAYEGDIARAENVLSELLQELPEKYEDMVKEPELLGVQNLAASEVILRVVAEVTPMTHWKMARALRKEIKLRLDEQGIEIPFPRLVMYSRSEDDGKGKMEKASTS